MKLTTRELTVLLQRLAEGVRMEDSFAGKIEYTYLGDDLWEVRGAYRLDNHAGNHGRREVS